MTTRLVSKRAIEPKILWCAIQNRPTTAKLRK